MVRSKSDLLMSSATKNSDKSLIVVFGRGLKNWLLEGEDKIHAPLHAVPMLDQIMGQRAVYARMYVAHQDALPTKNQLLQRNTFTGSR
jgi:hypothetical protein